VRKSIVVVDSFYKHPDEVRRYALGRLSRMHYYPYQPRAAVEAGRAPVTWISTMFLDAATCPFKSSDALLRTLDSVTGETVDRDHWRLPFPTDREGRPAEDREATERRSCLWNCTFHVKPKTGQARGNQVHNHVTDICNSVGRHGWAGIIYLQPEAPLPGGLQLWQNRDETHRFDWMTPPSDWVLQDSFANVYNRLILVRGDVPHSGSDGWGNTIETGRLFQTFFFKVVEPHSPKSVAPEI
jgi:hypothetical protein